MDRQYDDFMNITYTNLPNIIGLCAKKRAGKDTLAKHLIDNYNYTKYAFADPLKKSCQEIFLLNEEQMDGNLKETVDERWGVSPRVMFQKVGTEIFREKLIDVFPEMEPIAKNLWVYRFKKWYEQELKKNNNLKVVITDCRFPNEINIVKELGGVIIKIERNNNNSMDSHVSEKNIDNINGDYIIKNNSSIDKYYEEMDKIMNGF